MTTLQHIAKQLDRRAVLLVALYAGLSCISALYILAFDWWGLQVNWRFGLGQIMAALGYGALFWAMVAAGAFYWLRLDALGRKIALGAAAVLALYLIAFWPGLYDTDSFSAVGDGARIPYNDWVGPSPILWHAILQHIPFLGAVPAFECALFAIAIGYACQTLRTVTQSRLAPILACALAALSMPIWYEVVQVSRETMLAIVSLVLVADCALFFFEKTWADGRTAGRILALCGVSYFLRSEAAAELAIASIVIALRWWLAVRKSAPREPTRWNVVARTLAPLLLIMAFTKAALPIPLTGQHDAAAYDMTLWIVPVGNVIHADEQSLQPRDLAAIYSVADRDIFISPTWETGGIVGQFWAPWGEGRIRPAPADESGPVHGAALRIIAARPDIFIDSRLELFHEFNAPHEAPGEVAVQPTQAFVDSPRPDGWIEGWRRQVGYDPIVGSTRRGIEQMFLGAMHTPLGALQWAILPDLVFLALIILAAPYAPGFAFGALLVASRAPILLLLAPDAQSKYFAPIEFALPFLLAGTLAIAAMRFSEWRTRRDSNP